MGAHSDFDILQSNNARAARKIKDQPSVKIKQAVKKLGGGGQIPTTNVFVNPQTEAFQSRADLISKQRALDISIKGFSDFRAPPILTGVGPSPSVLGNLAVGAARIGLRTPVVKGLMQRIGGRATTISPFGGGKTLAGLGTALGIGITADALIEGGGQALDKIQGRISGQARPGRGQLAMHPGTGRSLGRLPGVGGQLPAGTTIVKTWNTGTAQFARLADGRIAVQRKDGTIKTYRPQKHIVIPRNPRVGTLIRADKRLERLVKGLRKVVKSGKR